MPRYKASGLVEVVRDGRKVIVPIGEDVPEAQTWPDVQHAIRAGRLVAIPDNPDGGGNDAVIAKLSRQLAAARAKIARLEAEQGGA